MKKYLVLLSLLFATSALADTCSKNLTGPAFTAAQSRALCSKLPANLGASQLPQTTAAYRLGSASLKWINGFFSGSVTTTGLNVPVANEEAVAGAGTTTADAAALDPAKLLHQITGANGTLGWKISGGTVGDVHILMNTTAGVAKIYGPTGGTCNGGAADAACTLVTGIAPHVCWVASATALICS